MDPLQGRRLLLGVTASIAAYKSCELVRHLRERGAEPRVVMTPAATRFVGPITLQALSGRPVRVHLLDPEEEVGMDHIALARWAEALLVAPATADFIGRLAHGLADDLLTTLCLATTAPLFVAPAMNQQMWLNTATQANCRVLRERGIQILGPAEGEHACGETGPGRMLEPDLLVQYLTKHLGNRPLAGLRVLVSAGPTREEIDPVRFISNRSSGKMGFAIAQAAVEAGAGVTLVTGPVGLCTPIGVQRIDVQTASEMRRAVLVHARSSDIFVAAAAVADYVPERRADHKLKRTSYRLDLSLVPTPDILGEVAGLRRRPFLVGFAAETEDLQLRARGKLRSKGLDMVAANLVGVEDIGFETDDNALTVLWDGGQHEIPKASKLVAARELLQLVSDRIGEKKSSDQDPGCTHR
jgi:phosphopantothenoylcysteine decarboxylase/phosphopantothenate--cysteine ligase